MHIRIKFTWLMCLFALFSQPVLSAENSNTDSLTTVSGVAYVYKNEDFQIGNKQFNPTFVSLEWSFTTAYNNYFASINYDLSLKDNFQIDNTLNGSGEIENNPILLSREDSSISFGYNFANNFSVFGGYKYGKTKAFTFSNLVNFNSDPTMVTFPGGGTSLANDNSSIRFQEDGPFIGAGYTYLFPTSGSVSFNLAFADLNGEVLFNSTKLEPPGVTTFEINKTTGDTSGLSFSANWSDQLTDSTNYTVSLKIIRYQFDDITNLNPSDNLSSDVNFLMFSIGIFRYF